MKRKCESIEQASEVFSGHCGRTPRDLEITGIYHEYKKDWRQFKGFADYLLYMGF